MTTRFVFKSLLLILCATPLHAETYRFECSNKSIDGKLNLGVVKTQLKGFVTTHRTNRLKLSGYNGIYRIRMWDENTSPLKGKIWSAGSTKGNFLWDNYMYKPRKYHGFAAFELDFLKLRGKKEVSGHFRFLMPQNLDSYYQHAAAFGIPVFTTPGYLIMSYVENKFGTTSRLTCKFISTREVPSR